MATTVILNQSAVRKFLRGDEGRIVADLEKRGKRVEQAAGKGFVSETYVGRNRARVGVKSIAPVGTGPQRALSGALQAGRG